MNEVILTTVEEKLDLVLDRCKRNLSTTENLLDEWIAISRKIAENNPDYNCPLFQTYLKHLIDVDKLIFYTTEQAAGGVPVYRATATGLMFRGYVKTSEKLVADQERDASTAANLVLWTKRLAIRTRWLMWATWAVAVGAIGLVLLELWKMTLEHH